MNKIEKQVRNKHKQAQQFRLIKHNLKQVIDGVDGSICKEVLERILKEINWVENNL